MIIDVRKSDVPVTAVQFADSKARGNVSQAYIIKPFDGGSHMVSICDEMCDDNNSGYVVVSSKEHAQSLITAIEKVIQLGWLKSSY